ncbi:hypothetical protein HNP46_000110 [Pseudomonas nitritireducens]|uniref:ATP-binding protein n=1 Tax=Pseudomonas nitroreducens TaxID=46680 RepID=A0A7W7KED8_PSENT|nr:ATP-binding protein [Pseudomonas nitritireducens]MBB4861299.1 hypothetical protein [Pseudomonas nitritireducens]
MSTSTQSELFAEPEVLETGIFEGRVQLPNSFFAQTVNEYQDWHQAWFREALQNALDAGSTQIDFHIRNHPDKPETVVVTCTDNGTGMSRETLTDVFLSMGGSQKADGSIGGFGYAKSLLAFAHKQYTIRTRDLFLKGEGGNYKLSTSAPLQGVVLEVEMDHSKAQAWHLEQALEQIVCMSTFRPGVRVTLNGMALSANKQNYNYGLDTVLGKLSFKDNSGGYSSSSLWVRMNGLAMFRERVYGNSGTTGFEGIIDLTGTSKEMFTSNRDKLLGEKSSALNKIIQELVNDRTKLKLNGGIDKTLNRNNIDWKQLSEQIQEDLKEGAAVRGKTVEEFADELASMSDEVMDEGSKHPFAALARTMVKERHSIQSKLGGIPSELYPENFKVKHCTEERDEDQTKMAGHIATKMSLKRYAKLAAGWDFLIRTMLSHESYRNFAGVEKGADGQFYYSGKLIQTGFVFGTVEGLHVEDKDQESGKERRSILINPDVAEKPEYMLGDIVDLAHHELAHLRYDYHGEDFVKQSEGLRRICRREMGHEKAMIAAFEEGIAGWRAKHAAPKAKKEIDRESGYGM